MDNVTITDWTCYRCGETKPYTDEFFEPYRGRLRRHCRECPAGLPLAIRFWRKVNRRGDNECWLWTGAPAKKPEKVTSRVPGYYGAIWGAPLAKRMMHTHVVSWVLHHGPLPKGAWVLHTCDVKSCVNPAHLYLGDRTANMRDVRARGNRKGIVAVRGEAARSAKRARFFEEDIRRIRAEVANGPYGTSSRLAREYGVSPVQICDIIKGRRWKHVV